MIYTLTLNPALDYECTLTDLVFGTINRTKNEAIYFGGKGVNVSGILKELGIESVCLGFTAGFTGEALKQGVRNNLKLNEKFLTVSEGMTRINVKVHGNTETEINGSGPRIESGDLERLYAQLDQLQDGDWLICSGSRPQGINPSIFKTLIERLGNKKVNVVLDTTGEALIQALSTKPFLIKPNHHELEELFGHPMTDNDQIAAAAKALQSKGARNVLVSRGKDGALLVQENGKVIVSGACKGIMKSPIGAGDSMVAGFVAGTVYKLKDEERLRLAGACGSATAFCSGLAKKEEIQKCYEEAGK